MVLVIHIVKRFFGILVLGRSVVVHEAGGTYMGCANIDPEILSSSVFDINFPRNSQEIDDLDTYVYSTVSIDIYTYIHIGR